MGMGGMKPPSFGAQPMGGMMQPQSPMGMTGGQAAPMQGQMSPSFFPPKPGMFSRGGMSGGDMMGIASKSFGSGQSQEQPMQPPPSFYQSRTKAPPKLEAMQYESQRPQSHLNSMFGGGYG